MPYENDYFGEGISYLNDQEWIELTWKDKVVNLLDRDSLEVTRTIEMWPGVKEGWGLTLDPANRVLYATDGSAYITKINADTLQQIDHYMVTKDGVEQDKLNELEWVDGYIWANVFYFNGMVKIDPETGEIVEEVSFENLHDKEMKVVNDKNQSAGYDSGNNVCNGIAYDPAEKAFYVTGKRWNLMFKIKLDSMN